MNVHVSPAITPRPAFNSDTTLAPPPADPIFALLAEHRAAMAKMASLPSTAPDSDMNGLGDAAAKIADRILEVDPTTIAGCVALLRHAYQHAPDDVFPSGYADADLGLAMLDIGHEWEIIAMRNVARALDRIASM